MLKARSLFHARGYDALSIADLTAAIGINPPSFYAAFGSKLALYAEALAHYEKHEGLNIDTALAPGISLPDGVARLLRYASDAYVEGDARGCMVIEGARGTADAHARDEARLLLDKSRNFIRERLAAIDAAHADVVADYVMTMLAGLSASARNGMEAGQLQIMASIAAAGLPAYLDDGL